jgi:hypothetical protein
MPFEVSTKGMRSRPFRVPRVEIDAGLEQGPHRSGTSMICRVVQHRQSISVPTDRSIGTRVDRQCKRSPALTNSGDHRCCQSVHIVFIEGNSHGTVNITRSLI